MVVPLPCQRPAKRERFWCSGAHTQGGDCNPPGNLGPSALSCFFDPRVWARIQSQNPLLPSFTFEETEFALPLDKVETFISDIQQLTFGSDGFNGATWPVVFILFRPGGTTRDLIHPATSTSTTSQRMVWVEMGTFRPNLYLSPGVRLQKKLPGIQETFEQLMVCK